MAFNGTGSNVTSLNATNIASGTVPTARLASGTANSSTYLRGDQTWATISSSAAYQEALFTSSGTWTCPAGVTKVYALVIAGGCGGVTNTRLDGTSQDGPYGVSAWGIYTVTPGTGYTVTVGNGSAGVVGSATGNITSSSGASSFSSFLSCTGGTANAAQSSTSSTSGVISGSPYGNGSFNGAAAFARSTALFPGETLRPSNAGSSAVTWTTSVLFVPGAAGQASSSCAGGFSGVVLIRYVG